MVVLCVVNRIFVKPNEQRRNLFRLCRSEKRWDDIQVFSYSSVPKAKNMLGGRDSVMVFSLPLSPTLGDVSASPKVGHIEMFFYRFSYRCQNFILDKI